MQRQKRCIVVILKGKNLGASNALGLVPENGKFENANQSLQSLLVAQSYTRVQQLIISGLCPMLGTTLVADIIH